MKFGLQFILSLTLLWSKTLSQNVYIPIQENELAYEFHYDINDLLSGVVTHRWERRYGNYVKGSYSFLESNGMIRNVYYIVDGNHGYRAITKFTNPQKDMP
ncbi:cuticle protein 19-like [Sipha flava]|uniref:Cuticle protein 19 n=1 Tax=Sipha flava TaxID=143950 RepID=A0A2S2RBD7_9HEMI|nr:cuticle protein 19-like [Sipha flava]